MVRAARSPAARPNYRAYLSQLGEMGRFIDDEIAAMRLGQARGFTPPAVVMTGRDQPVATVAGAATPDTTVYYQPFAKLPASLADRNALQAEARRTIATVVIPAHQRLLAYLRGTYFPASSPRSARRACPTAPPITAAASASTRRSTSRPTRSTGSG